jgi:hypothetical protein
MSIADGQRLPDQPEPHPAKPDPEPQGAAKADVRRVHISPDRRRHQRVKMDIEGRFMRADKQDYPCIVRNISPGGLAISALVTCDISEHVILYLPDLGRFEGEVVRLFEEGFAVRLTGTAYKREKIANQLTWIINRNKLDLAEDRAHERIVPSKQHIKLAMGDGTEREGRLLDVSLGGASVSVLPKPDIGDMVTIGLIRGTVVRHHDQGIGIRFQEIQDPSTIERQFG